MSEPCHIMVALGGNENLCLMLEAPKCLGVDNAVTVTLKCGADSAGFFVLKPAPRQPAFHRVRRKALLSFLGHLADMKLADH